MPDSSTTQRRSSNYELLRILAMLFIIAYHFFDKNAFRVNGDMVGLSFNRVYAQFLSSFAMVGNNLFFLISAWFLCEKPSNLRSGLQSIWRLEKPMLFYSLGGLALNIVPELRGGGVSLALKSIFPLSTSLWWYPTTYAIFILLQPFYHRGLNALSQNELDWLVIIMLCLWSVAGTIPAFDFSANAFTCFFMLYTIIYRIKKYGAGKLVDRKCCLAAVILGSVAALLSFLALDVIGMWIPAANEHADFFVCANHRVLPLIIAICLFQLAHDWCLNSRMVNYLASLTFGMYLFHMYPTVKEILFQRLFSVESLMSSVWMPVVALGEILFVFVLCAVVEGLRKLLFSYTVDKFDKFLFERFKRLLVRSDDI